MFVCIGLISYSLYLWHQPLLAFGKIFFNDFSIIHKFSLIFLSILISIFSYFFIEKIFRDKNKIDFKIFFRTGFITTIFLILFSYINYNFFLYKNNTETLLAKLLVNNKAIYFPKMDERQFVKNRIIYENLKPKVLVIGSSRIMQVSNDDFNKEVLNLAVAGASIEDHIAITLMALEKFQIDTILLGADPWLFNKFNNQFRWKSISKEYHTSLKNIQVNSIENNILQYNNYKKNYVFYENILDKLFYYLNIRKLDLDFKENQIKNFTKTVVLRDGKKLEASQDMQKKIQPVVIKYSMKKYLFSDEYYETYKNFIKYLKYRHNKEVVLVLSPYHIPSYNKTKKRNPSLFLNYLNSENKFKELSQELNIKIIGSYDANTIPCGKKEFYDFMHPKDSCMKRIVNLIN